MNSISNGRMGNIIKDNLILAVETSSRIGSVAIALGAEVLAEATFSAPLRHSAEIFPAIRDLLDRFGRKPRDIEQVYISVGPGSFTGLRIAATFAKTMHLANAARIVAVDTLDVVAANVISLSETDTCPPSGSDLQAIGHERVAVIVDAKRSQFFIAVYERHAPDGQQVTAGGSWTKVGSDSLMSAEQFLTEFVRKEKNLWLLGDGLVYYRDKFTAEGVRFFDEQHWSPQADKVHLLGWQMALKGQFADPMTLTPNYLRRPDVKIKTF